MHPVTGGLSEAEAQKLELVAVRYAHRQHADWRDVFHDALTQARAAGVSYGRLGRALGMSGQGVRQYMIRNRLAKENPK